MLGKEKRLQIYANIGIDIKLVGYLECPSDWVGESHSHNFWEIIIQTDDFKEFEFLVISPNEMHEFKKSKENTISHLLYIGFDFKHDEHVQTEELKNEIWDYLRKKSNDDIYHYFFEKMTSNSVESTFLAAVTSFLINLLRKHLFGESGLNRESKIVSEVKDLINANMNKMFTIEMIASSLYISPKYLGEIFRRNTCEGILQYQKRQKMEKALILLRSGIPVKEVHQRLGYNNVQYFSTSFKSYYGVSPVHFYDQRK